MANVVKSSLQSILSGEPMPHLPRFDPRWLSLKPDEALRHYAEAQREFQEKLLQYLRRLTAALTGQNIVNEVLDQTKNVPGFGPLVVEVFGDYAFVDGTTPFPTKPLIGTGRDSNLHVRGLENRWGIGNNFSITGDRPFCRAVRYRGKIVAEESLSYHLELQHDDGLRLYWNGTLAVDAWASSGFHTYDTPVLTAGTSYPFAVEVCNANGDDFNFYVLWRTSAESTTRNIPYSALRAP